MVEKLPDNWVEITLGQITTKPQYGWTSKSAKEGDIKYLRTTDLSKGSVDWESVPYCLKIPDKISKYELNDNDILISRAGSVGLSFRITKPPKNAVFASYLIRFKAIKNNAKFIEYYLKSPLYWNSISTISAGIAVQNINATKLSNLKLPLPPLAEQERIVAKLDDLFSRLDEIKTSLNKIPVLLKNFRQQVLTQAVTGKLTEEWRKGKGLPKWKTKIMKDACEKVQSGGTPKGSKFEDSGIPFFKVYNIVDQKISFNYKPQYVSREIQESQCKKSISYAGDVLMNIVGPPLNKVAIISDDFPECNINQAITLFRPKYELNNKYLYYFLREGSPVNGLINETRGVVGQVNISLTQCRNFSINIPPLEEQKEIVRRVEGLFTKADQIQEKYENLKTKIDQLPKAILHKAFKGELLPRLESDGDARDLLREIEDLKKSAGSKPKKGKTKKYKNNEEELLEAAEGKSSYKK